LKLPYDDNHWWKQERSETGPTGPETGPGSQTAKILKAV